MKSLRTRLTVLFLAVTTLTLSAFGLYAHLRLSTQLEERFSEIQASTLSRLKTNLQVPLWNYDQQTVENILESEMKPQEVAAVHVYKNNGKIVAGMIRTASGQLTPSASDEKLTGISVTAHVDKPSSADTGTPFTTNGHVVVHFSRDLIDQTLRAEIYRRFLEILAVDLLLVALLTFSLRMFFAPLKQLRDGLLSLAHRDNEEAEELPEAKLEEFGEVIQGFNLTQRKLQTVIKRRGQAEQEARDASVKAIAALEQLKSTQEELVKSEKLAALGSMVKGIAHELNTPVGNGVLAISSLRGETKRFQDMVASGGVKRSALDDFLATVDGVAELTQRNLERSAELVDTFKQIAADKASWQRRPFQLREVVDDILTIVQDLMRSLPYAIEASIPVDLRMDSYPSAIDQVMRALLNNAVIHGFDGRAHGKIEIKAVYAENNWLELSVSDDGKGMDESILTKIFDPFFTTKLGMGGSGLGLNIAYNTVAQILGGKIEVVSRIDEGTTFTLRLPMIAPNTTAAA
jgi:signal transduction histidine kinase